LKENIERLDMGALTTIAKCDDEAFSEYIEKTGATICGRRAICVLLAMLGADADAQLLRYDTSGRIGGDYSNSVSYLSVAFPGTWPAAAPVAAPDSTGSLSAADRRRLLELARGTLAYVFEHERLPTTEELGIEITAPLRVPRGAFVTLRREDRLCGCRGQVYPSTPLYRTIMVQAVQSALYDNRFPQVRAHQLPALRLEISVLTQPRPVASAQEIVLGKHGIILRKGQKSALYLPQVAPEQGWNLEQTLSSLSRKAGLPADAWKDGASFSVFEAEVFGEPER
jgi:AmmeMemoRadiSam system protein A